MSFEQLKNKRQSNLAKMLEQSAGPGGKAKKSKEDYQDKRFWKPTKDENDVAYAVIRFLPAGEGQDLPWVQYFDHFFKGPTNDWYIEKSLTTIGMPDPLGEANKALWDTEIEKNKNIARARKRKLHYVSNILVISDPLRPENEGKVMLYDYGTQIHQKLMAAMKPDFADEKPIDPFDFWEGASFKLKMRPKKMTQNNGKEVVFPTYDDSSFMEASELSDNETALKGIYESMYDLGEFIDPKNFKSYDELAARLAVVLGTAPPQDAIQSAPPMMEEVSAPVSEAPPIPETTDSFTSGKEDEMDDIMSHFAKMSEED